MTLPFKTALIIGGSRGVGRDLSVKLSARGIRTVTVARQRGDLDSLKGEAPAVSTVALDAAADGAADKLIAEYAPDLLILAGGHQPKMLSIAEMSWQDFSAAWNVDTKIAFEFTKAALLAPLPEGAAIVSFSSGAALGGSPLSGGYAGAKRMQHFVSNYGKWDSERRGLGLKFYTIIPKQLIAGTNIAGDASAAYAGARSITPEQFMNQWEKPLTAALIGDCVIDLLGDDSGTNSDAYTVTGTGMETMA
jgi:3-oxoacyl-[acyl-carrier protein] reductase